jgi:hypothetical protein
MFGYLRVRRLAPGVTRADIDAQFATFANLEGYALAGVFVDQAHYAPTALGALIDAVKQYDARAVAVPALSHLEVLGAKPALDKFIERATGAQVLSMDATPDRHPMPTTGTRPTSR